MKLGVSRRMLLGFAVEIALFATAAVLAHDRPVVLLLMAAGLVLAFTLSAKLSQSIATTAREIAGAARGLANGDVEQELKARSNDDLGQIADAFRDMIAYQRDMAAVANAIARGDLSAEITPKSEKDVFGVAFERMRQSLRETVGELEHQALYDPLTDLPNRSLLHDRLAVAVAAGKRHQHPVAMLLLDLDRFKEINDTFGHHHGDLLLAQVAERLRPLLREADTLARLGGDEFAIVLPHADADAAKLVAERVRKALREPFMLEGTRALVGASVGIALYPDHGDRGGSLLRLADVAMYRAKRAHAGHVFYSAEHDEHSSGRVELAADLERAIFDEELELHYQPKLDCEAKQIAAVEALVRWRHPDRGLVAPGDFIPLAEQTGLIDPLTDWVLDTAIGQMHQWRKAGLDLAISINVSARSLADGKLAGRIAHRLRRFDLPPELLVVEITETALMADPETAMATIAQLRDAGVGVSIDDYGTGYSSLAYLKRLRAQELKIDREFVGQMVSDEGNAAIVRSTIALAHELGLTVVAEGVEDTATLDALDLAGCDTVQGFLLSRPVPADELMAWFRGVSWPARARVAPTPGSASDAAAAPAATA